MKTEVEKVLNSLHDCELKTYLAEEVHDIALADFVVQNQAIISLITHSHWEEKSYSPAQVIKVLARFDKISRALLYQIVDASTSDVWLDKLEKLSYSYLRYYEIDPITGMAIVDPKALVHSVKSKIIGPAEFLCIYHRLSNDKRENALSAEPHVIRINLPQLNYAPAT